MVKNPLGTTAQPPPSPPLPVPGAANAPVELPFENLKEGFRKWAAMADWMPEGSTVIAAGFDQATLASSATAAPPAKALPVPLPLWVPIPKPLAKAPDVMPDSAEQTDNIMILFKFFMTPSLPWSPLKFCGLLSHLTPRQFFDNKITQTHTVIVVLIQHVGAGYRPPPHKSALLRSP